MWFKHFFDLGTTKQYFILQPYLCIVVLNLVLLSFFFYPWRCLSVYDSRILLPPLVSSNSCSIFIVYYSFGKFFFLTHLKEVLCPFTQDVTILRNLHRSQWYKCGFEISWLGQENTIFYLIGTLQCCCYLILSVKVFSFGSMLALLLF